MGADEYNKKQIDAGRFTYPMITKLVKEWQRSHPPLAIDGYCGPITQSSIDQILYPVVESGPWHPWDGPIDEPQPKTRTDVYHMFGDPGTGTVDPRWERDNIIEVQGERAFPGVPKKWYFKIHKLLEPYAREGFRRAHQSSSYKIERAASFVFRHIRFDRQRPLSLHSWGIAIDIDREKNDSGYFDPKNLPVPWTDEWMKIWPNGVDRAFVNAMESCGWHWGGYWKLADGFIDPMHMSWCGSGYIP